MDLRDYLNNNKLSQDVTTLIGKPKINNPRTENHLHGVRKNRKSKAARRKKKQKKMMENQSVTSIDEYKKRYEGEKIGLSRVSTYFRLNDNTLNSSMDNLCEEFAVSDQETSNPNIQDISEDDTLKMSEYSELDDNTLNPSMELCEEFAVSDQKTSDLNIQLVYEAGPVRMSEYPGLDNNNSSMDHFCKESKVNNQKTLSSSAQATFEAGLFKMSKYPRLDNTFNPSMDLLYKESEINNQTSSSNVQVTSEAGPSRISKCSRLDNTLNPSMDHLCKESEVNETSSSNTPVTSNFFKMAIALMEFPERKLNSNEVSGVRRLVMKHILSMSKETCARFPCFYNNTEWHGTIIFNCANKETSEWLSNLTPKLTLDDGVQLRILDIDKLSKYHRAIIYVNESMITKDLLYFLEKQNEGLVTNDWIFFPGNESRDAKNRFVVYFGDSSLEVLKALEFRPFCGLERAVIKLINKEIKKEINEETEKDDLLNKSAVPPLF